jgi:hypothetical protein
MKNGQVVTWVLIVLAILLVGAGAWYFGSQKTTTNNLYSNSSTTNNTPSTQTTTSTNVSYISSRSDSHVILNGVDVYLYAPDRKTSVQNGGFCQSGNVTVVSGNFELVAASSFNNLLYSTLPLGKMEFDAVNGIGKETDPISGTDLADFGSYLSCNLAQYQFFGFSQGKLRIVNFFDLNGAKNASIINNPGRPSISSNGTWSFCAYDNSTGKTDCKNYIFRDGDFYQK